MVCGGWGRGSNIPPQNINPPSISGQGGGAEGGEGRAALKPTSSREGPGGQVPGSCSARGHRHTDIHTHPHNFLQPGSKQLRELPDRSRASLTAQSGRRRLVPLAGWALGTVPYLPAWRRGYVSMALAERSRAGSGSGAGSGAPAPGWLGPVAQAVRSRRGCRRRSIGAGLCQSAATTPGRFLPVSRPPGPGGIRTRCPPLARGSRSAPVPVRLERWVGGPTGMH